MTTLLYTHPVCLQHDTGEYHPECADRLKAILAQFETEEFMMLLRDEAPQAAREHLLRAHDEHHVDHILSIAPAPGEHYHVDPDTVMSVHSVDAVLRSAGSVVAAVDAVVGGQVRNAFCAVRPPGHHAERDAAMGFCFFNNAAVGALHARDHHGLKRVAVIDFDVHHGNGTQHVLWDEVGMMYCSTHQEHAYPNTGFAEEVGGVGRMVNAPLPAGAGSDAFREAFEQVILPALREFDPDLLIISAGFDAHASDPLAHMRLKTQDFRWVTEQLCAVAAECCDNRIVSVLEGGYDLIALAASVKEHVRVLMGS